MVEGLPSSDKALGSMAVWEGRKGDCEFGMSIRYPSGVGGIRQPTLGLVLGGQT